MTSGKPGEGTTSPIAGENAGSATTSVDASPGAPVPPSPSEIVARINKENGPPVERRVPTEADLLAVLDDEIAGV